MHETDKNSKKKNQREKLKRVRRGTDIERKRIVETKKVPLRWMELCMLFLTESNPFFKVTNDLKIFLPLMIYLLVSRLPSIIHTHTSKPLCTFVFGWIKSYTPSSGDGDNGSSNGNFILRHQTPLSFHTHFFPFTQHSAAFLLFLTSNFCQIDIKTKMKAAR